MAQLFSLGDISMITIIFILWWAIAVLRYGGLKSHLPVSFRIQNTLLSLYLVLSASAGVDLLISVIVHPSAFQTLFYFQSGVYSPPVTMLVRALVAFASFVELFIAFDMVQQRRKARLLALRLIPYLILIQILDDIRVVSSYPESSDAKLMFAAFVVILMTVAPFGWLYYFCRSKHAEELMTNVA